MQSLKTGEVQKDIKKKKLFKNPTRGGINYILFGYISEKRIEIKQ